MGLYVSWWSYAAGRSCWAGFMICAMVVISGSICYCSHTGQRFVVCVLWWSFGAICGMVVIRGCVSWYVCHCVHTWLFCAMVVILDCVYGMCVMVVIGAICVMVVIRDCVYGMCVMVVIWGYMCYGSHTGLCLWYVRYGGHLGLYLLW